MLSNIEKVFVTAHGHHAVVRLETLAGADRDGWRCGYIGVHPAHPWHGRSYDETGPRDASVHGGITWSAEHADNPGLDFASIPTDCWVMGFDCAHHGDTMAICTLDYVCSELESLSAQLAAAAAEGAGT